MSPREFVSRTDTDPARMPLRGIALALVIVAPFWLVVAGVAWWLLS